MTRVLVVGAGLGGLVAALALHDAGLDVEVREQAPALGEVGAGLTVSRGAQRVLAEIGVLDAVRARASSVRSNAFLHYRTGALLDGAPDHSDGAPEPGQLVNLQIHRADLHEVLAAALAERAPGAVRLDSRLVGLADLGSQVEATFAGGARTRADLVVGADGLRSRVRELLWGAQDPRFTGQVAYRCLVPRELAAPYLAAGRAAVYLGPGRVLNRYALRGGALVNCAAIAQADGWREEGWTTPATSAELLALYDGWHPDVLGLFAAAPADGLRKWALYDREPLARWRSGRVTLLGDAAHPMLPFLGLGSAMAIEDGLVLARALQASPDEAGLDAYERARRPRTTEVMLLSRHEATLVQARDPDRFDPAAAPSRNPALYDFDPPAVASAGGR
ncbi:MAG TPA: FAD-dependent monooxygenase [Mycobacteriales bacterium]|nr:FAD-dependent monooxygenase [Mycobacteriales bacterium]